MPESNSAEGNDRSEEQVSGAKVIAQALKAQVRWIGCERLHGSRREPRVAVETEGKKAGAGVLLVSPLHFPGRQEGWVT